MGILEVYGAIWRNIGVNIEEYWGYLAVYAGDFACDAVNNLILSPK